MGGRRIAAIALSGALVTGGTGAAIAAVTSNDEKKAEQAVLDDAATRLDVTPEKLRDALVAAQNAQIDQAVKDGTLSQEQADRLKAVRKQSGSVLGGPRFHGGPHRFGGRGFHAGPGLAGPKGAMIGDLADALGLSVDKLSQQLRSGRSIAGLAKAQGKSLRSVRSSVKRAAKTRLDKAVTDGDITRKQADRRLERLDAMLMRLDSKRGLLPRRHRHLRGELPPAPPLRPGSLRPGEGVPELQPPPGVLP